MEMKQPFVEFSPHHQQYKPHPSQIHYDNEFLPSLDKKKWNFSNPSAINDHQDDMQVEPSSDNKNIYSISKRESDSLLKVNDPMKQNPILMKDSDQEKTIKDPNISPNLKKRYTQISIEPRNAMIDYNLKNLNENRSIPKDISNIKNLTQIMNDLHKENSLYKTNVEKTKGLIEWLLKMFANNIENQYAEYNYRLKSFESRILKLKKSTVPSISNILKKKQTQLVNKDENNKFLKNHLNVSEDRIKQIEKSLQLATEKVNELKEQMEIKRTVTEKLNQNQQVVSTNTNIKEFSENVLRMQECRTVGGAAAHFIARVAFTDSSTAL